MPTRGRPPKFGRPASLLALTLPDDTIEFLQSVDQDLGWAIVKLAEAQQGEAGAADAGQPAVGPPDATLVPIGRYQYLIVVRVHDVFDSLPGVDLVPLGHGQAFLAFQGRHTLEGLELALVDRLEDATLSDEDRARVASLRDMLREWRRDETLSFHERSIVVVEQGRRVRRRGR